MGVALEIIAWTGAIVITTGVAYAFFAAVRWPVRIWQRGERGRAILIGAAVTLGLLALIGGSQVAP